MRADVHLSSLFAYSGPVQSSRLAREASLTLMSRSRAAKPLSERPREPFSSPS